MKTITFFCAFILSSFFLNAQTEFAPAGAKWTYGFFDSYQGNLWDGYETVTYVGDTIINDISMKKLERNSFVKNAEGIVQSSFEGNYFIYQTGEKVFDETGNLLYDFGAEVSDTLILAHNIYGETIEVIIISKNVEQVNDVETQTFLARTNCGSVSEDTLVINSTLASYNYFYAGYNHCILDITPTYHLRCYEDDILGVVQISEEPCDDIQLMVSTENVYVENNITLFPNPTSTHQFYFTTSSMPRDAEVLIYNTVGQLLSTEKWIDESQVFTLPHSGLFYVVVLSEGRQVAFQKVVSVE
jgi:hypothetical protein